MCIKAAKIICIELHTEVIDMFKLATISMVICVSFPSVALAQSLTFDNPKLGSSLTIEDFKFSLSAPNSDKAQEVRTYLNGMQNMAAALYFNQQSESPSSLPYCIPAQSGMFNTYIKPGFFYDELVQLNQSEPTLLNGKWKRASLDGVMIYALSKRYPCDSPTATTDYGIFGTPSNAPKSKPISDNPFDLPTLETGMANPNSND